MDQKIDQDFIMVQEAVYKILSYLANCPYDECHQIIFRSELFC